MDYQLIGTAIGLLAVLVTVWQTNKTTRKEAQERDEKITERISTMGATFKYNQGFLHGLTGEDKRNQLDEVKED